MTSEAEGRDETTKAGVTPDVTAHVTPDVTSDATAHVTAEVTPDVIPDATAEVTGAPSVAGARADGDAETADAGAETADGGTATARADAPSAPAAAQPTTAMEALATPVAPSHPSPMPTSRQQDGARIRHSLETIKTAVVWLIVIQILTILSPLLRVSLKWMLLVGLVLTLGSFAVGAVAYLKAQRAQSGLPE